MPGTASMVPGGADDLGWCRVCLKESCDHVATETHRVSVVAMIRQMNVDEVSLVSKPAHPEARLMVVSIPTSDLATPSASRCCAGGPTSTRRLAL